MPVRKRNLTRRSALDESAQAWLRGEKSGFFEFKPTDELEALWNEYVDENMFWGPGMPRPISRQALAACEDSWVHSGTDDQYGANSYFIVTYYNDDEKQSLWNDRGDHENLLWTTGMRGPEPKP